MGVLGVDACSKGWAGILIADDGRLHGLFATAIPEMLATARGLGSVEVVAVDMPIGLPDRSARAADAQARQLIGPRRSSVFSTPARSAITEESHAAASARNRELTGKGISQQAFALRVRLLEVDAWMRVVDVPVIEVHPEVSFTQMAGQPLAHPKSTWAGMTLRRGLLAAQGLEIPDDVGGLGRMAAVDDVLDAAAAAWTALRAAQGRAIPMPDPPERFSDGLAAAIWR
jgi:predicted RNase H-like nuclease